MGGGNPFGADLALTGSWPFSTWAREQLQYLSFIYRCADGTPFQGALVVSNLLRGIEAVHLCPRFKPPAPSVLVVLHHTYNESPHCLLINYIFVDDSSLQVRHCNRLGRRLAIISGYSRYTIYFLSA